MTRHRAAAGKDDSPGHIRRLAPQFAIYEIGQPPEEQAEGDTASDVIMDAQPAQSILAREVKNAERHADDSAVEGHATLPQFEDVERVFKNRWLIEKHISHSPAQNDAKRSIEDHVVCMATSHRSEEHTSELQQIPIADQDARQIGE